jgi:hypothetical protein
MKITLIFILICTAALYLQAQNLDSLYAIWQDPDQHNHPRIKACEEYFWNGYLFSCPNMAVVLPDYLTCKALQQQYMAITSTP